MKLIAYSDGIQRVLRSVLAIACLAASAKCVLFAGGAWLNRTGTIEALQSSIKLDPYNPTYLAQLAKLDVPHRTELLKHALSLNPYDSALWIQAGTDAELRYRDPKRAQFDFLKSAQIDHTFLPRWTLADFYFRHHDYRFLQWAQAALKVVPYSGVPILTQLWKFTGGDTERIDTAIPDRQQVLVEYTAFLANLNELDKAEKVAERALVTHPLPGDKPVPDNQVRQIMASLEDRLLQNGKLESALPLWSSFRNAGWIQLPSPSTADPLTNGAFGHVACDYGFDWHIVPVSGVMMKQSSGVPQLSLSFLGTEPENCQLLSQYLPLAPGKKYRLIWRFRSENHVKGQGLRWRILKIKPGFSDPLSANLTGPDLAQEDGDKAGWKFTAPLDTDLFLLSLDYSRPLGMTRIEGNFSIGDMAIERE